MFYDSIKNMEKLIFKKKSTFIEFKSLFTNFINMNKVCPLKKMNLAQIYIHELVRISNEHSKVWSYICHYYFITYTIC